MATTILSRLDPFDCANGDLDYYLEQFDNFLALNAIEAETKKVPLFISCIGQDGYMILKEVCAPLDPREKQFEELIALLHEYLARKKFYGRNQHSGEILGAYINELKCLSTKCNFGLFAKDALRDRIACGKLPESDSNAIANKPNKPAQVKPAPVSKQVEPKQQQCKICGYPHQASECPYRNASCHACGRKGHIATVCRDKADQGQSQPRATQVHVHVQQNAATLNQASAGVKPKHRSKPAPPRQRNQRVQCGNCGKNHSENDCPEKNDCCVM